MKHLYPLITLLFLAPLFSKAQINYKPGFIVSLKGDTTYGFINYREWKLTPSQIDFKTAITDTEVKKVTVENATAFTITNAESYESHTLKVTMDYVDVTRQSIGLDTSYVVKNVFLQKLNNSGNVTLYEYSDDVKLRLFVSDKGNTPVELSYKSYYNPEQTQQQITQKRYTVQLMQLASEYGVGSDSFSRQINNTDYNETPILGIINKINGVIEGKNSGRNAKKVFQPYIGLALNAAKIRYTGETPLANGNSKTSMLPQLSIGTNIYFDQRQRYYIKTELGFKAAKSSITESTESVAADPNITTATFNQYSASLAAQFVLNVYNQPNFKLFIAGGFEINFSKYTNHTYATYNRDFNQTTYQQNFPVLLSNWGQVPLTVGTRIKKKFEIYATYMTAGSIVNQYVNLGADEKAFQFGVNYLFGH
jgi:hypothetical protein